MLLVSPKRVPCLHERRGTRYFTQITAGDENQPTIAPLQQRRAHKVHLSNV